MALWDGWLWQHDGTLPKVFPRIPGRETEAITGDSSEAVSALAGTLRRSVEHQTAITPPP